MSRKRSDGASERDHAASAARQFALAGLKPKRPPVVEGPECPALLTYLWGWFLELAMGIAGGGFSVPVVTWEALDAWSRHTGNALEPWEAQALVMLGQARAVALSETKTSSDGDKG